MKIVIGERRHVVTHKAHPEVRATIKIPTGPERKALSEEMKAFRKKEFLRDDEGEYFRDKKGKPIYEEQYELAREDTKRLLRPFLVKIEGLEIIDNSGKPETDLAEVADHDALVFDDLRPVFADEEDRGRPWKDELGRMYRVKFDPATNEPIMEQTLRNFADELFSRVLHPPIYGESDRGKDSPTPSTELAETSEKSVETVD